MLVAHEARESEKREKPNDLDGNLEDLVKYDFTSLSVGNQQLNYGLLRTLTSIDEYAREKTKRSSVKRFLMFKSDIAKISEYRERLSHALNIFWVSTEVRLIL